jgi:hypothetical protein
MQNTDSDCSKWEEIHGFSTPGEYEVFSKLLNFVAALGEVQEIPVDPDYGHGRSTVDGGSGV